MRVLLATLLQHACTSRNFTTTCVYFSQLYYNMRVFIASLLQHACTYRNFTTTCVYLSQLYYNMRVLLATLLQHACIYRKFTTTCVYLSQVYYNMRVLIASLRQHACPYRNFTTTCVSLSHIRRHTLCIHVHPVTIPYQAIVGSPVKRHLNGVSLVGRQWLASFCLLCVCLVGLCVCECFCVYSICLYFTVLYVSCSLVITCWEKANLAPLCVVCPCVLFPIWCLGSVWYLIVSGFLIFASLFASI